MTPRKMNFGLKIILGVLFGLTIGGLYFANSKLTNVATSTSRLKAQVELGNKQIAAYEKTQKKVSALDYVDELAAKVLPADEEQSLVVAELSEFALRSRLSVDQITFASTSAKTPKSTSKTTKSAVPKGVLVVPINIKFQAGAKYEYLLDFLKSLENNRRKMQVTNISLTPDLTDRTKLSQVSIDINLYAREKNVAETKK